MNPVSASPGPLHARELDLAVQAGAAGGQAEPQHRAAIVEELAHGHRAVVERRRLRATPERRPARFTLRARSAPGCRPSV